MADQPIQFTFRAIDQLSPATQAMRAALARLETILGTVAAQLGQMQGAQMGGAASTAALAGAYGQLASAMREQTAAYTAASAAALAYKQQQDTITAALRAQRQEASAAGQAHTEIWRAALGVAGGVGIATSIQAITSAIVGQARAAVETTVKLESLRLALNATTGSSAAGASAFQAVVNQSVRLGLNLDAVADGFKRVTGATRETNLQGAGSERILEGVAVASRAYGLTAQQTTSVLVAFEQMISKGTVSLQELRLQLANALPGALGLASRALNVTTADLFKMVKAGLDGQKFVSALAEQMIRELGPAAERASKGMGAAFERMKTEWTLLQEHFVQNSGAGRAIGGIVDAWSAALRRMREAREGQQAAVARDVGRDVENRAAGGLLPPGVTVTDLEQFAPEELEKIRKVYQRRAQRPHGLAGLPPGSPARVLEARAEAAREEELRLIVAEAKRLILQGRAGRSEEEAGAAEKVPALLPAQQAEAFTKALEKLDAVMQEMHKTLRAQAAEMQVALTGQTPERQKAIIEAATNARRSAVQDTIGAAAPLLVQLGDLEKPGAATLSTEQRARARELRTQFTGLGHQAGQIDADRAAQEQREEAERVAKRQRETDARELQREREREDAARRKRVIDEEAARQEALEKANASAAAIATDTTLLAARAEAQQEAARARAAVGEQAVAGIDLLRLRLPAAVRARLPGGTVATADPTADITAKVAALQQNTSVPTPLMRRQQEIAAMPEGSSEQIAAKQIATGNLERVAAVEENTAKLEALTAAYQAVLEAEKLRIERAEALVQREEDEAVRLRASNDALEAALNNEAGRGGGASTRLAGRQAVEDLREERIGLTPAQQERSDAAEEAARFETQRLARLGRVQAGLEAEEQMYRTLGSTVEQTFGAMWGRVFSSATASGEAFARGLLQDLQQSLSQVTGVLVNDLLSRATGTPAGGSWGATLVRYLATLGSRLVTPGVDVNGEDTGLGPILFGADSGVRSLSQPLMIATRPSFSVLGDDERHYDSVVPSGNSQELPVALRRAPHAQGQAGGDIHITLQQNFDGVIDPRSLRTNPQEMVGAFLADYTSDGPTRRVILNNGGG